MEYMSAKNTAEKWGISQRRVAILCAEDRIADAKRIGNMWLIPETAQKPVDARTNRASGVGSVLVKPFLKWAGGKGQLLGEIAKYYPFCEGKVTKYVEPFVGGGAVLFDILNRFDLEEVCICDNNVELINAFRAVRDDVETLIELLTKFQKEYLPLDDAGRKIYYAAKREHFNDLILSKSDSCNVKKAALMLFLNKTCFNGLYRVNRKGQFNVPIGAYKNPLICDEDNLRAVSEKLQKVTIICGDFKQVTDFVDEKTFVYFDPPYRPLSKTAGFTAYTEDAFTDKDQVTLAEFFAMMDKKGTRLLLSNSDPHNADPNDDFFDRLYDGFTITRVNAVRMINSKACDRGKIKELLISNF